MFREFGGGGIGSVVDQQLSRDSVLLDDLRGTLHQVMAWDHTQGGLDPGAAGGGGVGDGQEHGSMANPALADESKGTAAAATAAAAASNDLQQQEGSGARSSVARPAGEENGSSSAGENNALMEHIPVVILGRRAEAGAHDPGGQSNRAADGGGGSIERGDQDSPGSSRGNPAPPADLRGTRVRGSRGSVATAVSDVDSASTTTTTTTTTAATSATASAGGNGNGCVEWVRKQQRRTVIPAPLTDDERMSLLQHVRPSVFGAPSATAFRQKRRQAVAYAAARPRSAAAATGHGGHAPHRGSTAVGGHYHRHLHRHGAPRAATARRRSSRDGTPPGASDRAGLKLRAAGGSSVGSFKHEGVLVHDGWIDTAGGEDEGRPGCTLSASLAAAGVVAQASPGRGRFRSTCGGGGGGTKPVSLVNSIAFGVNMGVLDALSDTTGSATATAAFASVAPGEITTTASVAAAARGILH